MKLTPIDQYIKELDEACRWIEATQGRASQCKQLLEEIPTMSDLDTEHMLNCFEALDLVDIYRLWVENVELFPGLKDKIKQIFNTGPLLVDYERADKANTVQSRNDAFSAIIAGRLLEAQLDVVQVEKCRKENTKTSANADCTIKLKSEYVNVECKRLHSQKNWSDRVEKAKKQIRKSGKRGIVALDCSKLIRPKDSVYSSTKKTLWTHKVIALNG